MLLARVMVLTLIVKAVDAAMALPRVMVTCWVLETLTEQVAAVLSIVQVGEAARYICVLVFEVSVMASEMVSVAVRAAGEVVEKV